MKRFLSGASIYVLLIAAVALVVAASCAPQKDQAAKRATGDKPYEFEKEGKVPPLSEDQVRPETDFEEIPLEEEDVVGEEVEAPLDTTRVGVGKAPGSETGGPPPLSGVAGKDGGSMEPVFRVQILAVQVEAYAQDAKRTAELKLKLPVYVDFVGGLYKVSVGDCSTRAEVEKVLRRCRESGYPDAWVVTGSRRVKPAKGN